MNTSEEQAIAEAATNGPWFTESGGIYNAGRSYMVVPIGDSDQDRTDATFIATFNPSRVKELLAERDQALEVVRAAQDIRGMIDDHQPEPGEDDDGNPGGEFCFECETEWPCPYGRIAASLDAWEASDA
jgi:hypothetical protein